MRWILAIVLAIATPVFGQFGSPNDLAFWYPNRVESAAYTPHTAGFDGANDSFTGNAPTGLADANTFTISVWLDFTGGDGTLQQIYRRENDRFSLQKTATNTIQIIADSNGGTRSLNATTSVTKTASDGWFHLFITIDMANSANRHIYFDGVEDASVTWTTYLNNTLDLNFNTCRFGAGASAANKMSASMCEFYHSDRYLNDVTKFRDAGTGKPISLGSDGSLPDGIKPGYYFSQNGSGDSWIVDSANGNTMTLVGALGSPSPP